MSATRTLPPAARRAAASGKAAAGRPDRRPLWMLAGVAVAYLGVQVLLVPLGMTFAWDESMYVSQYAPGVPPSVLTAPRSIGMGLLVAPATLLTASVAAIRLYLAVLSALCLFLAFLPWLALRGGRVVPLAAALYGGLWLTVFYGGQAMPNVYTSGCTVAAVALFPLAATADRRLRRVAALAGLVAAFAVMSLLRPMDAPWTALPLVAAALVYRPWRRVGPLAAVAAGSAVGWGHWLYDAHARFGGPARRLELIDQVNGGGLHFLLLRHVESFGSTALVCRDGEPDCGGYTAPAVLLACALPPLVLLGLWASRRAGTAPVMVLATGTAVVVAVPYLFLTGHANPRYLLPSEALLALPVAAGLWWLAGRGDRPGRVAIVGAVVFAHLAGQAAVAAVFADRTERERRPIAEAGAKLRALGVGSPCFLYGYEAPELGYLARCGAWGVYPGVLPEGAAAKAVQKRLAKERKAGRKVVVVAMEERPGDFPRGWRRVRLLPDRPLYAHLPPGQ
ncbi:hypothetical protein ACFVH6_00085 [Spirillospora sp. NPDC127200]